VDAAAVTVLRDELPPGAAVLQLPDVPYPEIEPILDFTDYEHFRPALHGDGFCWSYGVLRGRDVVGLGLDDLLRDQRFSQRAARAGFDAVWVDLRALTDDQRASLDALMNDDTQWLRPRNDVVVRRTERNVGGCLNEP
jgi:phosphoglycerol transferase